jgi:hypothetical protein
MTSPFLNANYKSEVVSPKGVSPRSTALSSYKLHADIEKGLVDEHQLAFEAKLELEMKLERDLSPLDR